MVIKKKRKIAGKKKATKRQRMGSNLGIVIVFLFLFTRPAFILVLLFVIRSGQLPVSPLVPFAWTLHHRLDFASVIGFILQKRKGINHEHQYWTPMEILSVVHQNTRSRHTSGDDDSGQSKCRTEMTSWEMRFPRVQPHGTDS